MRFASRFCSLPPSAARSCSSGHHFSVLCPSACNSHHNSGTVVTKSSTPVILFNSDGAPKVSRVEGNARGRLCDALFQRLGTVAKRPGNDHRGFMEWLIVSLCGRSPARYCASNARSAAATVEPIPTIPSSTLGPSCAIQRSPRKNSWGWRTAEGLPGWAAQ